MAIGAVLRDSVGKSNIHESISACFEGYVERARGDCAQMNGKLEKAPFLQVKCRSSHSPSAALMNSFVFQRPLESLA